MREPLWWLHPIQVENDILGHLIMEISLSETGSGKLGCYQIIMAKAIRSFLFRQRQGSKAEARRLWILISRLVICLYCSVYSFSPCTTHKKKTFAWGCNVWSNAFLCAKLTFIEKGLTLLCHSSVKLGSSEAEVFLTLWASCLKSLWLPDDIQTFDELVPSHPFSLFSDNSSLCFLSASHT